MNYEDFIKSIDITLDEQQEAAVKCLGGAVLVLAVPGSGKTTTMVCRLGYMVKVKGIPPEKMLVITFTKAAAKSMKEYYERIFGESHGIEFCTIHSLCQKVLSYFEQTTGRKCFDITDADELLPVLKRIIYEVRGIYYPDAKLRELMTEISCGTNSMQETYDTYGTQKEEILRKLKEYKISNRIMDYDDQLRYAYDILRTMPDILSHFQNKYRYISVDEAQDTSLLQHKIIQLLYTGNIFMVGDEDQSIFSFRAAYPDALLGFEDTYENAKVMRMEKNYRCTGAIVKYADNFIHRNSRRYDKKMHSAREYGTEPQLIKLHDFSSCYAYAFSVIRERRIETAVLCRASFSALPLIDLLETAGERYNLLGSEVSFYNSPLVRKFINILRFIENPYDDDIFLQMYRLLGTGMSREDALFAVECKKTEFGKNYLQIIDEHNLSYKDYSFRIKKLVKEIPAAKKLKTYDAIDYIIDEFLSRRFIYRHPTDLNKVNVLLALAIKYPDKSAFIKRIEELLEIQRTHVNASDNLLTVSTIHSAKGLEYDRVIMLDVKPGQLPDAKENDEILQEDRRIMYVGMTRAKNELLVFTSEKENQKHIGKSRFIDEIFYPKASIIKSVVHAIDYKIRRPSFEEELYKKTRKLTEREKAEITAHIKPGNRIYHVFFEKGIIIGVSGDIMRVKFHIDGNIRPISISKALKNGVISTSPIERKKI